MLELLGDLARVCGDVALSHFRKGVTVERKADGSEVTVADREAERAARDWIRKRFPEDGILGEEFGHEGLDRSRRWIIDPIDGTRTFVRGVPLWGSLIAVEEDGVVVGGAVNCAAIGDLVVAYRGDGCWHNGSRTGVSSKSSIAEATILVTDARFRANPHRVPRWQSLGDRAAVVRTWGDCYGYVLVATGRAELMVDDRLGPWDVAPMIPIIEEAGGVITDWRGRRGIGPDAIATNAALADEFRALLGVPETG